MNCRNLLPILHHNTELTVKRQEKASSPTGNSCYRFIAKIFNTRNSKIRYSLKFSAIYRFTKLLGINISIILFNLIIFIFLNLTGLRKEYCY